jgi:hypothetical protein
MRGIPAWCFRALGGSVTELSVTENCHGRDGDEFSLHRSHREILVNSALYSKIFMRPKSKRDNGTFSRSDFQYDPTSDVYHRRGGKWLGTSGTVHEGKTLLYRASKLDCDVCCPKGTITQDPAPVCT